MKYRHSKPVVRDFHNASYMKIVALTEEGSRGDGCSDASVSMPPPASVAV